MISKQRILIALLASLAITHPMTTTPVNRFRSAYKTIRTDISCLFGNKNMDAEQKKRVMIELAVGIALVGITGGVTWFWWVRPLQRRMSANQLREFFSVEDEDSMLHKIRSTLAQTLMISDAEGSTALHHTAKRPFPLVVEELIKLEPQGVNTQNSNGDTPLHVAASIGNKEIVELFLNKGANPTITNRNDQKPGDLARIMAIRTLLQQAELDWPVSQTN